MEKMRWSQPLGEYDDEYYEQATFVLVKESPNAIRIKLIDKYRKKYDGLVFWMPKKITKSYNDRDPNIKTAWFWEKGFYGNMRKALAAKEKNERSMYNGKNEKGSNVRHTIMATEEDI